MTRRRDLLAWLTILAVATGSVGCGEGDDELCDADDLRAALAGASAGDEVHAGPCRMEGPFEVPAGVTLSGEGIGQTILFGPDDDVTVDVTTSGVPAIVRDLSVESTIVGIRVLETGTARIERVEVTASKGMAIGVDGLTRLELASVTLLGPINAGNADDWTSAPVATETAIIGLAVLETGAVQLDQVAISGFAGWGALLIDSGTTWTGGSVMTNLLVGVHVQGGEATLEDLEISETLQGSQLVPSLGLVASDTAAVDSTGLQLHDNENISMVISAASGWHTDLEVTDGGDAAVWLQHATDVALIGAELLDNGYAGVMALASSDVQLSDVNVERTALVPTFVEDTLHEFGDGVQLAGSTENITIEGATLDGNGRVGLFIDLGGADDSGITLTDVHVNASGDPGTEDAPTNRGAIIQNGTASETWDSDVTRDLGAEQNDGALVGDVEVGLEVDNQPVNPDDIRCVMGPNNDCE